ncbi:hypothetical protein CCP4SC76_4720005 [Gammaproteobacteria bacterium]
MTASLGSAKEAAQALGVTVGRIHQLCQTGRVRGATQISGVWLIPMPPVVKPPKAARQRPGKIVQGEKLPAFLKDRLPKRTAHE